MNIVPIFLPPQRDGDESSHSGGGSFGFSGGGDGDGAAGIPLVIVAMLAVLVAPIIIAISYYFNVRLPIPGLYDVWPIQSFGDFVHSWIWMSFDLWFWGCLGVIGLMIALLFLTPFVGLIQLLIQLSREFIVKQPWKNKGRE